MCDFCYSSCAFEMKAKSPCGWRKTKEISMLAALARGMCIVGLFFASIIALAQSEFSADLINNKSSGTSVAMKIYFAKDKMRVDSEDKDRTNQSAGIVNFSTQTVTVLMKQQKMYMEMPAAQSPQQRLMVNFFQSGDVENACGDWQRIVRNQGGTCHKVGHDTVNGCNAVKYEGTSSKGETGYFWLDTQLRFPVKWQNAKDANDSGELRNIQEGPQPASLFEVPAGYTKFDMGSMMKQR
jgi:hypothetical protein